jgi:hypothetical protein
MRAALIETDSTATVKLFKMMIEQAGMLCAFHQAAAAFRVRPSPSALCH